jgi:hypothetical protein
MPEICSTLPAGFCSAFAWPHPSSGNKMGYQDKNTGCNEKISNAEHITEHLDPVS